MELWNKRDLRSPPVNSVKMKKEDIDVMQLKFILDDALKILKGRFLMHREAAVLSRFVYKSKQRQRGHKSLMYLEKIYRGLKRYLSLDLEQVYSTFSMLLPCVDSTDQWLYIPTKQMLEYLLVQTQGFSKIMSYITNTCQIAAHHCVDKLHRGHIVNDIMMCLSMVSRIWYCSRYYIVCACDWYSQLLPYLEKVKIAGINWLPDGYKFPSDLRTWLGPDSLTGELMSVGTSDIEKISQEIIKCEEKDTGIPITRDQFVSLRDTIQNKSMTKDVFTMNMGYKTKYDKLFKTVSETAFRSDSMKPLEATSQDLGELILRDPFTRSKTENNMDEITGNVDYSMKYNTLLKRGSDTTWKSQNSKPYVIFNKELSSTKYPDSSVNDYGETITREQFASLRSRTENVTVVGDFTGNAGQSTKYINIPKAPTDSSVKSNSSKPCVTFKTESNYVNYSRDNLNDFREVVTHEQNLLLKDSRESSSAAKSKFTSEEIAHNKFLCKSNKSPSSRLAEESRLPTLKKRKSTQKNYAAEHKTVLKKNSVSVAKAENKSFVTTDGGQSLEEAFLLDIVSPVTSMVDSGNTTSATQKESQCISLSKSQKLMQATKEKSFHAKTLSTSKSTLKIDSVSKARSSIKQISVVPKNMPHGHRPIIEKKPADTVKIINEIKNISDLKVFLHKEKKARLKGKKCVTSHLDKSKWKYLVGAVNKSLKKMHVLNIKGRQTSAVMGEIRNCLVSLIT